MNDERDVSAAVLGAWLGISGRAIRDLAERTIIERNGRGRYPLQPSVRAYAEHMREIAAGRAAAGGDGALDLVAERARHAAAMADAQEMRNDIIRGEVVLVTDVVKVVAPQLASVRSKLLAAPREHAPALARCRSPAEVEAALTSIIVDILKDLSGVGDRYEHQRDEDSGTDNGSARKAAGAGVPGRRKNRGKR